MSQIREPQVTDSQRLADDRRYKDVAASGVIGLGSDQFILDGVFRPEDDDALRESEFFRNRLHPGGWLRWMCWGDGDAAQAESRHNLVGYCAVLLRVTQEDIRHVPQFTKPISLSERYVFTRPFDPRERGAPVRGVVGGR